MKLTIPVILTISILSGCSVAKTAAQNDLLARETPQSLAASGKAILISSIDRYTHGNVRFVSMANDGARKKVSFPSRFTSISRCGAVVVTPGKFAPASFYTGSAHGRASGPLVDWAQRYNAGDNSPLDDAITVSAGEVVYGGDVTVDYSFGTSKVSAQITDRMEEARACLAGVNPVLANAMVKRLSSCSGCLKQNSQ